MLNAECLAHLDPRDLGNGVPFVGGLQRSGQQGGFGYGLGGEFGVNAGGSEEEEFSGVVFEGGGDDVGLDLEVDCDEVGRVSVVGVDAANLSRGKDDVLWFVGGEKGIDGGLRCEVKLGVGAEEEVGVTKRFELPDNRGSHQAAVAGDENGGGFVDGGWIHGR